MRPIVRSSKHFPDPALEEAALEEARRNLFSLLHLASERVADDVSAELQSKGLPSPGRARVVLLLHLDMEGNRVSELATRTGLSRSTVSTHVRHLEAAGLLRKVSDPSDGRALLIMHTDSGMEAVRHILAAVRTVSGRYARSAGQRRMTQLSAGLRLVLEHPN